MNFFVIIRKKVVFLPRYRGVAQLASVLAWGARGRKFESSRPDKKQGATENVAPCFCFLPDFPDF